jgi:hypothetical protein
MEGEMAQSEEPDLAEAVGTLAREKSAAEQYAVVLSMAAKQDMPRYLRGISLYADAKSEFDGLVTQLVFDLKSGNDLAASPKFSTALATAAEKRVTFTDFVSDEVVGRLEGTRAELLAISKLVPEIVKSLTNAGLAIWKAFRLARKERQTAILDELERLKWRSFAELPKR